MIYIITLLLPFAADRACAADTILFRAPGVIESEYRARLRADDVMRSPSAAYLNQHPTPRAREQVLGRFTRAQKAFLNGDVPAARQYFREVVALVPSDDWSTTEREVFLNAYLRLAQLDDAGVGRDHWLIEAQYLGEGLKLDEDLFPPPVVARYRQLARQLTWFTPKFDGAEWPLVLINGLRCRPDACPRVPAPAQNVRVTFVSDEWVPQTFNVDAAKIARVRPARLNFVTGDCGKHELSTSARALGEGRAFFGFACESPSLAPRLPSAPVMQTAADVSSLVAVPTPTAPKPAKRSALRSPWMWVSIGSVLLAGVLIASAPRPRNDSPSPPSALSPPTPTPTPPASGPVYGY